jgi:uncharacterized protein YbjT (DUF2867 family)
MNPIRRAVLLGLAVFGLASVIPVPVTAESDDAVFVLGGTRGTGLKIVRLLEANGRPVTALVRASSDLEGLKTTSATLVTGDAMDGQSIEQAMATGQFVAAISTLSGTEAGGWAVDSTGNINAIKAAEKAGITKFVLISSVGVGDSKDAVPPGVQKVLAIPFREKGKAETYLIGTDLNYTIIRPGGLTNKAASGKGVLLEDPTETGVISRAELARLTVDSLDDTETTRKTFAAVER